MAGGRLRGKSARLFPGQARRNPDRRQAGFLSRRLPFSRLKTARIAASRLEVGEPGRVAPHAARLTWRSTGWISPPTLSLVQERPWPSAYFNVGNRRAAVIANASEISP